MIKLNLDIAPLMNVGLKLDQATKQALKEAGRRLTNMTRAHIVEEANKKLHTRRQMFLDGLTTFQMADDVFVVNLDAKVRWIDDGMQPHNMIDDLLKSKKAKTAKDGSKYAVIPFSHKKGPTQQTPAQKTLLDTIKRELKQRKIDYGKTEKDEHGSPKLGLLHSFSVTSGPIKTANAPGQGKGPIGSVMQGPTGIPLLKGIRIYQREVKDPKSGKTSIRKDIMTFRVVSSKHKGQGRWDHPGTEAVRLMDEAYDWAKRTWEREVVPQMMTQLEKNF